ncbi:unnamed protein product, partial [Linum tenue]
ISAKVHVTDDGRSRRRFVIPLEFLNHTIFRELLRLSEEQLGLPSDGPITLPCHPSFLEYLIGLVQSHRSIPEDMVKALLMSISAERNSRTNYEGVDFDIGKFNSSPVANRGHFVVYTDDFKRFVLPLSYLGDRNFQDLFRRSEEEFGVSGDGPIMVPCDAAFLEDVVWRIQKSGDIVAKDENDPWGNGVISDGKKGSLATASPVRGAGGRKAFRSRSSLLS